MKFLQWFLICFNHDATVYNTIEYRSRSILFDVNV